MRVSDFAKFIERRENHRIAKFKGWGAVKGKADPIIKTFRFCNVRRNDDRVTQYIMKRVVEPWADEPFLWFGVVVARLFNNESTLDDILRHALPFKPERMRTTLFARKQNKLKNFNAAYVVSTNGRSMDKIDYLIDHVLKPLWDNRKAITRDINVGQLANVHLRLMAENGLASFMAAQIVADLKYADPDKWEDFHTFAASGPGSKRGLNRVLNRDPNASLGELDFRRTLLQLRDATNARLDMDPITAQDIQNCLCEFDKYERVKQGEGKTPKQLYKPVSTPPWDDDA